ncbi:amidase [Yinghuangia sp. YIM S09857]|uniref:amidase n=1 Tax=Yinghuangia sp. YIM S09857 TaxID=3436929 RepID=UPI003F532032
MTDTPGGTELWTRGGTEIAAGIRAGEFTATEVAEAFLRRIDEVNPAVNALADVRPDEVLARAAELDRSSDVGEHLAPLHGVPVATKINTARRGYASSHGIPAWAGAVAAEDAACVAALRDAGATLLGRSNSPAFAVRWFTDNALHGRTLNPWSAAHTPGGSSGGAAAALASGMVPIAQGNDIGGSIRYPAYCCGAFGLRPTVGLVSGWEPGGDVEFDSPMSFQTMAVQGPLAWTVADLRAAVRVMATPDPRDPVGIPAVPRFAAPGRVRVTVVRDVGIAKPHRAVDAALDTAAGLLAAAGYEVEEAAELPELAEAARLWSLLLFEELRTMLPEIEMFGDAGVKESLASTFRVAAEIWGEQPTLAAYIRGYARRGTLITRLQRYLGGDRILLTPVSAEPPLEQDADLAGDDRMREVVAAQWPLQAVPVLGFPAAAVPTGLADGLPSGVQVIAGRFREDLLLDAAEVIEAGVVRPRPVIGGAGG